MIMKSLLICLLVLTLSFDVSAIEVQEEPKIIAPNKITPTQKNSPDTDPSTQIVNGEISPQASAEKPSEFMTALSVYLIIIVVYSIYGIKANSKA